MCEYMGQCVWEDFQDKRKEECRIVEEFWLPVKIFENHRWINSANDQRS